MQRVARPTAKSKGLKPMEKQSDEKRSDFETFDSAMRTILSVSKAELQKREKEWKRNKAKKKRAKS